MRGFARRLAVLIGLGAVGLGQTVSAEVRDASPSGFTIENTVLVPVSPATAWAALVHDVDRWWPKDHSWWGAASTLSIDPRAGGCFCETAGERQAEHLRVVFVNPPQLLRLVGGLGPLQGMGLTGVLEWRLVAADGGTRITLWYRAGGYGPDDVRPLAPRVDQVQALQLGGLAAYLRDPARLPAQAPSPSPSPR